MPSSMTPTPACTKVVLMVPSCYYTNLSGGGRRAEAVSKLLYNSSSQQEYVLWEESFFCNAK